MHSFAPLSYYRLFPENDIMRFLANDWIGKLIGKLIQANMKIYVNSKLEKFNGYNDTK